MSAALADKLQIWGIEDDFIIFSDGSLGFCLEVLPIDVACWDEYELDGFHEKLCQFLNALPSGLDIQFVQDICSGNAIIISENEKICLSSQQDKIRTLGLKRVGNLRSLDESGMLPVHSLKILVRKKLSSTLIGKKNLFSKEALFPEITEGNLKTELKKCTRIRNDLLRLFNNLGLVSKQLDACAVIHEVYRQWNPGRKVDLGSYDPSDIRDSVLFTDVVIDRDGFSLGKVNYKVISLKVLPSQTFSSMATVLRSLPFDSRLFLSVNIPDQTKEIESLQTQRRLAFSMVYGKQSGVSDLESEAKLDDLEGLLAELISQGEKIFHFGLTVLLKSTSKDELEEQVSQTLMTLRELSGAEGMEETIAAFDIYAEFAFPNSRVKERIKRIKTSNLADLLPVYGPWVGHKEPKVLLRSRMGSLVKFNPFSRSMTNANQIISGGSGSGKSFLTNLLLIQMLKEDPLVFIVDIGGSYKKSCENLSGQYIPLGVDSKLSINPFDLSSNDTIPNSEKIKFLLALIESMTKEENESGLKKLERSEIEEAIQQVYKSCKYPQLSDLRVDCGRLTGRLQFKV